jgi:hypothetical protein
MKLRFGLHLDGQHGRLPAHRLGDADVGPLGLLGILETQLGLAAADEPNSKRIVQYRDFLLTLNSPDRFYHRTLAADDFGTAATLLAWRDEWRLCGWHGIVSDAASPRLKDMAEIETLAVGTLGAGPAERLTAINQALGKRKNRIKTIELVDPVEAFPPLWRRVLAKLPCTSAKPMKTYGKGIIGEVQRALLATEQQGGLKPLSWKDDGTLIVSRSETTLLGSRWLTGILRQAPEHTLLVATSEAAVTDAQLGAADHPRQGLSDSSAFRPSLQLLPLLIELLWEPLNFHSLIQFLTYPIGPLPQRVRRRLAGIQTDHPGIGGPRWRALIDEIVAEAGEDGKKLRQSITFWVEPERYDPNQGAPIADVLIRIQRLADTFRHCPADAPIPRRLSYAAGLQQCQACGENLSRLLAQGVTTLRPRQLEQLVRQSTARGNDNPLRIAEVGALACVTHPGAVIDTHPRVVWGSLDMPALPPPWPWSKSEIAALRTAGCDLPDADARLRQAAREWLRPILAVEEQLVLLLPPEDRETHPVWQILHALLPDMPVQSIESLLRREDSQRPPVEYRPLPAIKRWWQLPDTTTLPEIKEYSYSQLEKQVFNPYHWLLSYPARLRAGSLLSLNDDFRLKGILAHSLVERYSDDDPGLSMSDADFASWFSPVFDRLITEEGALYLMPGRRNDLENLRFALRRAMIELRDLLRRAGVSRIESERELSGHFSGGPLKGKSDLVLERQDGMQAIVDLKWSGKTHRDKLERNRHLQLALYAELLRQASGTWPSLAYFLLSQATLLTRDDVWFPGVTPVPDKTGENSAQLWQRFLVTWKWRQTQFSLGRFEVVLEPGDDEDSQAPDDGLGVEPLPTAYNDCLHLAGWSSEA